MINIIKFLHLILALSLLGSTVFCFATLFNSTDRTDSRFNSIMIILALLAMLTGTFLVYPKHFTFHTPWIQAAYLLVTLYAVVLGAMSLFAKKWQKKFSLKLVYLGLMILLILVIHDAVTKTTFLL